MFFFSSRNCLPKISFAQIKRRYLKSCSTGKAMDVRKVETLYIQHLNLSSGQTICLAIFSAIIMVTNVGSSSFLCYAIWKLKLTRNISHRFVLAMGISDCSIGLFLQPTLIAILYVKERAALAVAEFLGQIFAFTFAHFSSVMILIIALDRFMHMKHLNDYTTRMTPRKCVILIAANAIGNALLAILSVFSSFYGFFLYLNIIFSMVDFALLVIIFMLYTKTYWSLRSRVGQLSLERGTSSHFDLSKSMLFVLFSIFLCYLPFNVVETVIYFQKCSQRLEYVEEATLVAYYWSLLLIFCCPSFNSILFIVFSRRMRRFSKPFLRRRQSAKPA